MPAIDLVPPELKPKRAILNLANTLKRIAIVGFSAFLISVAVIAGGFFIVSSQLNKSLNRQDELKRSIKALEETEKRLVLVQDRLAKVKTVLAFPNSRQEIGTLESVVKVIPEGASFNRALLTKEKAIVNISSGSSSAISKLLASVLVSQSYKKIELVSFSYAQTLGYQIELAFTK